MDDWTPSDFASFIYNEDYIKVDPDYVSYRPLRTADEIAVRLRGCEGRRILDFGSGSGLFAERMRAVGYRDISSYDPFSMPDKPSGVFDIVTCFEVIEHSPNPLATFDEIAGFLNDSGMIIVGQTLQPVDIDVIGTNWWYLAPRNGHVSTFSLATFQVLADRANMVLHVGHGTYGFGRPDVETLTMSILESIGPRHGSAASTGGVEVMLTDYQIREAADAMSSPIAVPYDIEITRSELPAKLRDGDPAIDDGIDAGRNIRAGYERGVGLEFGTLHPVIDSDPDWIAGWEAAQGRSIVTHHRLMNIFLIMKYSNCPTGNIIEFGSYRGGSALLMAMVAKRLRKDCKVYALDTFEGMPKTDQTLDRHSQGNFAGPDLEELHAIKARLGLDNLIILKGLFEDTVQQIPEHDRRFFLTHVDCDIYDSVKFSIRYAKDHGVAGSYIICDDPLTADCLGAMKAVEEELFWNHCHAEQVYPHLVFRYPPLAGSRK